MKFQELLKLIYENDIPKLIKLKESGIDFSMLDSQTKGNLLLSYSLYGYNQLYSQSEMIDFLVESRNDVNYQSNGRDRSKSALHKAVGKGHFEIVKSLIKYGAIIDIKDQNGNTPLWNAVMMFRGDSEQLKIIKYLLSKGSSLNIKNNHDISPQDLINHSNIEIDLN